MAARDSAKENNAPYGNIFTTTPGYRSSKSGAFAYDIYKAGFKWTEKLYDTHDEDGLLDLIKKNINGKIITVILEFNHRQLGYTDDWLRGKVNDAMSKGEDAGADFFNLWAEGNASSPIKPDLLKAIQRSKIPEPHLDISKQGYITRWYINKHNRDRIGERTLVNSIDTSDAIGKDDIAMTIRDSETAEVIATGKFNETNLSLFSEWLLEFSKDYENMTYIIERKSSGMGIMDYLIRIMPMHGMDPFRRMFNWVVNDHHLNAKFKEEVIDVPLSRRSSLVYDKYKKFFGYNTTGSGKQSRDNIYGTTFIQSVKYTGDTVRDKDLIDQLAGLTIKNNRIDHSAGSHDDMVFAWLLGYWFLSSAQNKDFYGINSTTVLSTVTDAIIEEEGGVDVIVKRQTQVATKKKLDGLLQELKDVRNPIQSKMLLNRIRYIYRDIDTSYFTGLNIEAVIENIMLEKNKNKSANNKGYGSYRRRA